MIYQSLRMMEESTVWGMAGQPRESAGATATLSEEVGTSLRADIIEGRLGTGKIGLKKLADRYGVGMSPLREALFRLSVEGLVEANSRRGFTIRPLTLKELNDITALRQTMDSMSLRESIRTGDTAWEARIVAAFHHLSKAWPATGSEWQESHRRFHYELLSAHDAPVTQRFRDQLFDMSQRYRLLVISLKLDERDLLNEHRAIMQATLDRDADRATALLVAHYGETAATVARYIEDGATDG